MTKNRLFTSCYMEMPELASFDPQPIEVCNLALGARALCWVPMDYGGFWCVCLRQDADDWLTELGEFRRPTHYIPLPATPVCEDDDDDDRPGGYELSKN
jgi:hypothetical protein